MKVEDRIHQDRPARFATATDVNGKVLELGLFLKPDDPFYNERCEHALRLSMKYTLETAGGEAQ